MQIIKARLRVGKRSYLEVGIVSFHFTRWGAARALIVEPGGQLRTVRARRIYLNVDVPTELSHVVKPAGQPAKRPGETLRGGWFDSRGKGFGLQNPFGGRS